MFSRLILGIVLHPFLLIKKLLRLWWCLIYTKCCNVCFSLVRPHFFLWWWTFGCFYLLAIINNASVLIHMSLCEATCCHVFWVYQWVGSLGHMVSLCLSTWGTSKLFPSSFSILHGSVWGFLFSHPGQHLVLCIFYILAIIVGITYVTLWICSY
jgi:hypothetical protein